jgi:hypothetical protein
MMRNGIERTLGVGEPHGGHIDLGSRESLFGFGRREIETTDLPEEGLHGKVASAAKFTRHLTDHASRATVAGKSHRRQSSEGF